MKLFLTFKPAHALIRRFISYYYLDVADGENYTNEYLCYPHFNTTLSVYRSHRFETANNHSVITADPAASPLQIFTPLREHVLKVTQRGPVHKLAIVFEPLGIQQFLAQPGLPSYSKLDFFGPDELARLFESTDPHRITACLDQFLAARFSRHENEYLESALKLLHDHSGGCSIDELAQKRLGISRKHLNRLFHKYLGTTPQRYRSIVRFRKLMSERLSGSEAAAGTPYHSYYADQAHFIKECRHLTGLTPTQFFNTGSIIGSEDTFWKFTAR